ncbi:MAG: aminopeptidase N [Magnetococcales bacterium]|nr:aminopeptidase N [Magnetococcales bacterium]
MTGKPSKTTYLKAYQPPQFLVDHVDLTFRLEDPETTVDAVLTMRRNPDVTSKEPALILNGRQLTLDKLVLDGATLSEERYQIDEEYLTIADVPERFTLAITTRIRPAENTSLEGLYKTNGIYCTQCEAEGFRKITYFPDRPDVMARFRTTIIADPKRYPVRLSNGNPIDEKPDSEVITWEDPFPKPCYLFALVAGPLALKQRDFVTVSGRTVDMRIYVEPENIDRCDHALDSLARSMRWDEEKFGREYDLDIYMIVAVNDFNMGAMENKGLNVFNAKYVLAKPETATDTDYEMIEGVIAHEYFHNWTGNRITCRDWFQLSLKEGLTVYRDQEFSSDMTARAVQRVNDVRVLRTHQFAEDSGPTAHPVQPDSYMEINNFYTMTIYNKGAEVVRMIQTLLGRDGFRKGMDLYFERHDGQAVTVEAFVKSMEDANQRDLGQFRRWYKQAGTPALDVESDYDAAKQNLTLTIRQACPSTPGQTDKKPFHIPISMALLDAQTGEPLPLFLKEESETVGTEHILELTEQTGTFTFSHLKNKPIPSLLRDFSAPVNLNSHLSDDELIFLWGYDTDPFNRWESGQELGCRLAFQLVDRLKAGEPLSLSENYVDAFKRTLLHDTLNPASKALSLMLPEENYLISIMAEADPGLIHKAMRFIRAELGGQLADTLTQVFHDHAIAGSYRYDTKLTGKRSLRRVALGYLMATRSESARKLAWDLFQNTDNMTDCLASLTPLVHQDSPEASEALQRFHDQWKDDPLVMDKWLSIQAMAPLDSTLDRVVKLMDHPAFSIKNPNRVRALIGAFCAANPVSFHNPDGSGYHFLADRIRELDPINPQVSARMVTPLCRWQRLELKRARLMRDTLQSIADQENLSRDLFEMVSKSLVG